MFMHSREVVILDDLLKQRNENVKHFDMICGGCNQNHHVNPYQALDNV